MLVFISHQRSSRDKTFPIKAIEAAESIHLVRFENHKLNLRLQNNKGVGFNFTSISSVEHTVNYATSSNSLPTLDLGTAN